LLGTLVIEATLPLVIIFFAFIVVVIIIVVILVLILPVIRKTLIYHKVLRLLIHVRVHHLLLCWHLVQNRHFLLLLKDILRIEVIALELVFQSKAAHLLFKFL